MAERPKEAPFKVGDRVRTREGADPPIEGVVESLDWDWRIMSLEGQPSGWNPLYFVKVGDVP